MGKAVYCHFSFRKPRNEEVCYFAVMFSKDYEGKKPLLIEVTEARLWNDQQFINAIQSYSNALYWIWRNQKDMKNAGVDRVYLVSGNSTILKWIEEMPKQKDYRKYMILAKSGYRMGEKKEIELGIGICPSIDKEVTYKYCNQKSVTRRLLPKNNKNKLNISGVTAGDMVDENEGIQIDGMEYFS